MPFNKYTKAKIEDVKIEPEVTTAAVEAETVEESAGDADSGAESTGEGSETSLD